MTSQSKNKQAISRWESIYFFIIFIFYLSQYFTKWKMLSSWNIDISQNFSDFQLTWRQIVCGFRKNPGKEFECAELDSEYIYGHILTPLAQLRFLDDYIELIAFASVLISVIVIIYFIFSYLALDNLTKFVFVLLFISPPIQLLIQRGNLDLLLTAFLLCSSFLVIKGRQWSSFFVISFVALVKLYALPALVIFCAHGMFRRNKHRFAQVLITISILIVCAIEYLNNRTLIPSPKWGSFGFMPTTYWISEVIDTRGLISTSALIVTLVVFVFIFRKNEKVFFSSKYDAFQFSSLDVIVPIFLVTYFLVSSFDYRLIILDLIGITVASGISKSGSRLVPLILLLSLLSTNYFSFNTNGTFQALGDLMVSIWVSYCVSLVLFRLSQLVSGRRIYLD